LDLGVFDVLSATANDNHDGNATDFDVVSSNRDIDIQFHEVKKFDSVEDPLDEQDTNAELARNHLIEEVNDEIGENKE
jgi:hypothetical protein